MISIDELVRRMSISKSTLYLYRRENKPPFDKAIKIGRRVLLAESVFIEWARCLQPNTKS